MSLNQLTGAAVQAAQLHIANYCLSLEAQSGDINLTYVVTNLNNEFKLVPPASLDSLINDIQYAYNYVKNQEISEMSRAGWWKFRAYSAFEAKTKLIGELRTLGAIEV